MWHWIKRAVRKVAHAIAGAAKAAFHAVHRLIRVFASILAFVVHLIFLIPILGRLLNWIWNVVILWFVYLVISIVDILLTLLGIMIPKRLGLMIIIQLDEQSNPVADFDTDIQPILQPTLDVFRSQANVHVVAAGDTPSSGPMAFSYLDEVSGNGATLDVCCNACAAGKDLWTVGTNFEAKMAIDDFIDDASRIVGYASPVCAFAVRTISIAGGTDLGCSLWAAADYVTVNFRGITSEAAGASNSKEQLGIQLSLAHELGHACNLPHSANPLIFWGSQADNNLMNSSPNNRAPVLNRLQKAMLRASRHVTFLGPIL